VGGHRARAEPGVSTIARRALLAGTAALPLAARAAAQRESAARAEKVLRYAFNFAETGFDPPRVSDESSIAVIAHIFEAPLTYDWLADPVKLVPQTAAALPEASEDFKHWVVALRPGIYFSEHAAFEGKPRELVAADYVYSIKRLFDPQMRTEHLYLWETAQILGLAELRQRVIASKAPFPYDEPVAGLRVLDRYRFAFRLAAPAPRFAHLLANTSICSALAREVVERHADDPNAHPVGTGPFMLAQWRRASRVVLVRNPRFREQRFSADPPEGHADAQAIARHLQGARAPLLDRIEFDVIEEAQPRWLAFLRGDHDAIELPTNFAPQAMPGGRLAPYLAQRGVWARRELSPSISHTYFNFNDPLVGGYHAPKVALRRAVALAYSAERELRIVRGGQGVIAHSMIPPHCYGYEAAFASEMGRPSPARARALLDVYGYADRDGDGYRETPEGRPLVLRMAFTPTQRSRQLSELWQKCLRDIGVRIEFEFAPFGELIRRGLAGTLMTWGYIWSAGAPDGDFFLGLAYGPNAGQSNDAHFKLAAFDRLYERQRVLPDGPERAALMRQAQRLMLAYVPYISHFHPVTTDLAQPHLLGLLRHPFNRDRWRWMDVLPPLS
jgi:ABC-type transport system substrate-binding protein